jgi:hypothetical protein
MARHYSLNRFLREAPHKLLRQHLRRHKLDREVAWAQLDAGDTGVLRKVVETAQDDTKATLESEFKAVFEMGDSKGVDALLQEGHDRHHRVDLAGPFAEMSSDMERAYWTFLKYPTLLQAARDLCRAGEISNWHKLACLPESTPATDDPACEQLGRDLSSYYQRRAGLGKHCVVDDYSREGSYWWFCYPEDRSKAPLIYKKNELRPRPLRPAFEVIFQYNAEERSLKLHARGRKATLKELQRIFCNAILGFNLSEFASPAPPYELDWLLNREYPLTLLPEDPVEKAYLRGLTLQCEDQPSRKITLEASGESDAHGVHDLLDAVVAGGRLHRGSLRVHRADFSLVFRRREGETKGKTLRFYVTAPDTCSLKSDPLSDFAAELLKRWGLDVSGPLGDSTSWYRRFAQHRLPF